MKKVFSCDSHSMKWTLFWRDDDINKTDIVFQAHVHGNTNILAHQETLLWKEEERMKKKLLEINADATPVRSFI